MWSWSDGLTGWGWVWMAVMMFFVWLPLLVGVIWVLSQFGRRKSAGDSGEGTDARWLARREYARGEIDGERYLQIMQDLEKNGAEGGAGVSAPPEPNGRPG